MISQPSVEPVALPEVQELVVRMAGHNVRLRVEDNRLEVVTELDVSIHSPNKVEISGDRGIRLASGEAYIDLSSGGVAVSAPRLAATITDTTFLGERIHTKVDSVRIVCSKFERVASRVVESAREVYQRIEGLLHVRAGRTRSESAGNHLVQAETLRLNSTSDVRIRGKSINLC